MRFTWLRAPGGTELEVENLGTRDLSMAVPLVFAEGAGREGDVLLWLDPAQDRAGLYQKRSRAVWNREEVAALRIVMMRPDEGPGLVGLELVTGDEEVPVLAGIPFSEELLDWFRERRGLWEEYFGYDPRMVDYGLDR